MAIPTVLATVHATDSHFRWWWPTDWMSAPVAVILIGLGLAVVPVRRPARPTPGSAQTVGTDILNATSAGDINEQRKRSGSPQAPSAHIPGRSDTRGPPLREVPGGHAFLCYVREDAARVDSLQRDLEEAGISVWRDTFDLWPGEDWRTKIRRAITDDALVFIACFSTHSVSRAKSHQNEELALAIDQLRMRRPDVPWLIPVRFDDSPVPDIDLGGGRTLASLQWADLFGEHRDAAVMRLLATVRRLLGQQPSRQNSNDDPGESGSARRQLDQEGDSQQSATDILNERFRAQWADDISLLSKLKEHPSFQDISAALRRSSELHIISKHGIRAPLEHTSIYVRIPHPDEWLAASAIPIHLEKRWMEHICVYEWKPGESFVDVFFSIASELRSRGHWEGERNYSPDETFTQFADLLLYGVKALRNGFDGVVNRVFQIVGDDWVITEWSLIDKANYYQILFERLNELDWLSHVGDKGWVNRNNFHEAFGYAEMLIFNRIFEGNLPPGWKLPTVWPFKTVLDSGDWEP
jgi:hypothetical protein